MSPQFLTLFSAVFILLGAYNLFTGLKRMREARIREVPFTWYKQINLLTGTEYILLALVFILSTAYRNNTLPPGLKNIVLPVYLVFLLAAAVLAGLVIRQGILNTRMLRAQAKSGGSTQTANRNGASPVREVEADRAEDDTQRAVYVERRRERRRNAAAARRRRAGKA